MKKTFFPLIALGLLGMLLLSACQAATGPALAPASLPTQTPSPIPLPTDDPQPGAAQTSTPLPTASVTPASATSDASAPAVQAAQAYFAALKAKDFNAAADLTSTFSLSADGMTRGDGADELHTRMQNGTQWDGLQVKETKPIADKTVLAHVTYTLTTSDPKTAKTSQTGMDEWWALRNENGKWLYNRKNLIDFRSLSIDDQTTGGLRIKPLRLARYADRIQLTMMVQNTTNETIVLGQVNEILASFSFKDQQVEVEKQQLIFGRLQSYPDATIEVKGLFSDYPDGVAIRQWKNLKVAPWFAFQFTR